MQTKGRCKDHYIQMENTRGNMMFNTILRPSFCLIEGGGEGVVKNTLSFDNLDEEEKKNEA